MLDILIIDDDRDFARSLEIQLELKGNKVNTAHTAKDGIELAVSHEYDVILLDLKLRETDGLNVLSKLQAQGIQAPVVMITGEQDAKANIEAVKQGVVDYLRKPFDMKALLSVLDDLPTTAAESGEDIIAIPLPSTNPWEVIGQDPKILDLLKQIGLLTRTQVSVMIHGESGSGKEIIGRALHEAASPDLPFIAVNCTAIVSCQKGGCQRDVANISAADFEAPGHEAEIQS